MLPKQLLWLCEKERLLIGAEALALCGYPKALDLGTKHADDTLEAAAIAMPALPCQLALVLSACAAISWASPGGEIASCSSVAEVSGAVALLEEISPGRSSER